MAYTFISGATGGIGKAYAIKYATLSENLFLTGRDNGKLQELKRELSLINPNIKIEYCSCHIDSELERKVMLSFIDKEGITFNRIINVAGVDIQKPFCEYTEEKVLMQIRVNVEATIFLTHALLKRGEVTEILTISSMSGVTPMPNFALYSATKAMLTNFFSSLRLELKGKVKVTTVLPGGVYTRPDIVQDIKGQGLWGKLSAKKPEFVVRKSLKALKKNKAVYVPGFFNKLLYFIMKITPKCISMRYIKNRWKKLRKDAF